MDLALTLVGEHGEDEKLEMFALTKAARSAVAKTHKRTEARESRVEQISAAGQAPSSEVGTICRNNLTSDLMSL